MTRRNSTSGTAQEYTDAALRQYTYDIAMIAHAEER
jgi:hypothetical protein